MFTEEERKKSLLENHHDKEKWRKMQTKLITLNVNGSNNSIKQKRLAD